MKTSTTLTPGKGWATGRLVTAVALALAVGSLLGTSPLRAEEAHHNDQQQPQHHQQPQQQQHGHDSRQTSHHEDHGHGGYYGNQDYVYAPPPVVYEPAPSAGITLVLPIQFR
jgi:hypothetical protein